MKIKKQIKYIYFFSSLAIFMGLATIHSHASDSQTPTPPDIEPIALSDIPLHSSGTRDKPTITLALSVEFPTIGALYRDGTQTTDASYDHTKEYIGYFYSQGCYEYLYDPQDTPTGTETKEDYKRFKFTGEANQRKCTGQNFSGNFLNWSASSSIDILRIALSGGDRYIDKDGLTILQRAVIPVGTPTVACLWNNSLFFPAKKITKAKAEGAIPKAIHDQLQDNDSIWIANRHNKIYFNKYSGNNTPTIRGWADSETGNNKACQINGEVTTYSNYVKSFANTNDIFSDGFFYARVEACTKNANGLVADHRDFGLCTQQANGNFKPTGVIQKHANNLRISAFGYTLHHDQSRYGGVLRAPMRYVGAKSFDIYGREEATPNPYAEWDPYTGIIYKNPHATVDASLADWPSSGAVSSGVINYLNKFGRMGSTVANDITSVGNRDNHYYGEYKSKDPVSSLYHQALRYLQGLSNIEDATNNLKLKDYDGFPIYKNWATIDPFGNNRSSAENYACLKNNIVVIGDIAAQENNIGNNNTQSTVNWKTMTDEAGINYETWRKKAFNYESNSFQNSNHGIEPARQRLIGYAYWAHSNDIRNDIWANNPSKKREGLRVKTFTFDVNEEGKSSDLATRRKNNQFYLAAKYGGFENDPNNLEKNFYSTNEVPHQGRDPEAPNNSLVTTNAIWERRPTGEKYDTSKIYDAATYYLQSNARSVLSAFDEIFDRATSGAQSISQTSSSSSSINATTNSHIYTGTYDMGSWTGNIVAKRIVVDEQSKNVTLQEDTNFDPAAKLKLRNSSTRNIVIGLGGTSGAANFTWADIEGTDIASHLSKTSISATVEDNLGSHRVSYLRGDRALEGTTVEGVTFRTRTSLLGDIINAGVSYSGNPTQRFTDKSYRKFLAENGNRLPIVLTGANDGMLHAFAASDYANGTIRAGDEIFAYIPSWLAPRLPHLTSPDYVDNHEAFVDAPSAVGEAQFAFEAEDGDANEWKTVLVSGTGAGGRGVFALDITNPTGFNSSKVLWEFTNADDRDMGFVVGKPKILKFKTGENTYQWFAAVASGVNNYSSDFDSGGGSGAPTIFLLALNKGAGNDNSADDDNEAGDDNESGDQWILGTNYFKISFPVDASLAASTPPGIIDFSALWSLDGAVTHLYAGDLHGNLWKLDFTDANTTSKYKPQSSWNMTQLSAFKKGNPSTPYPFYRAQKTVDNTTKRQPISAAPLLVQGPIVQGLETFYVAFGTGKYLETSDVTNTDTQSFYVLYDDGSSTADDSSRIAAITPGVSRLQAASVDTNTQTITVPPFTWGRPTTNAQALLRKSGWYFDFPDGAERMIYAATDMGVFNITFNSIIPGEGQTDPSICSTDAATSNVYDINIRTGGGKYRVSQIGVLGPSLYLENEEKTTTSDIDSTGRAKRTLVREEISSGTTGHAVRSTSLTEIVGRLSWRQIYNYKELKHKSTPATPPTTPPGESPTPGDTPPSNNSPSTTP